MTIVYIILLFYVVPVVSLLFFGKYYYRLGFNKIGPSHPMSLVACIWPIVNVIMFFGVIVILLCGCIAYVGKCIGVTTVYKKLKNWYNNE